MLSNYPKSYYWSIENYDEYKRSRVKSQVYHNENKIGSFARKCFQKALKAENTTNLFLTQQEKRLGVIKVVFWYLKIENPPQKINQNMLF